MRWVRSGGLLVVFPAGEVSQYRLSRHEVSDPQWKNSVTTIIRHTKPAVVPVFFQGRNSIFFQIAGLVHPRLRTLLLARELLRKRNEKIHFKIGNTISSQWVNHYADDGRLLAYLRWRTYVMGHTQSQHLLRRWPAMIGAMKKKCRPVARPQMINLCQEEIARLPLAQRLVQSGPFSVWQARAGQIPHILLEIGRLREISFRQAGEGTNKPLDLDRFDAHYIHLFVWHEGAEEIVGAYRIGQTDQILGTKGKNGLYTNTLFQSQDSFFEKLGPALELGRSFIRPEYQKTYLPLLLLWKGIGAFIVRHPGYRVLFGPVSISGDYNELSRQILAKTLIRDSTAKELAVLVKPKKPIRMKTPRIRGCDRNMRDIECLDFKEASAVVSDIEVRPKGIPILLRHYLNLGGQLLSFNIDKSFSGVMDGLIMVDLLKTNRRILERYMGAEGVAFYFSRHSHHPEMEPAQALGESA